MLNRTHV
jgi:hypothetical protein